MTDRDPIDPIDALLRQPDRPVAPSPAFARRLRERVAANLAPKVYPKGDEPMLPHAPALPVALPAPARRGPARRPRSWLRAVEIAAVLVLMVGAVGGYVGAGRFWAGRPGEAPVAGTPAEGEDTVAAMWGGDAGRTGAQPGPGPQGEVALRWRSPADEGYVNGSAPVALGDRVYRSAVVNAGTEGGPVVSTFVEALDAGTGRRLWRTELDVFGAPAATASMVYVMANGWVGDTDSHSTSALVALDAATGGEAWRARTGNLGGAIATSPIVLDDTVYAADPDGTVYARDAETGEERWTSISARSDRPRSQSRTGRPATSASGAFAIGGGGVYVVNSDGDLHALAADSGAARWNLNIEERFGLAPQVAFPIAFGDGVAIWAVGNKRSAPAPDPVGLVAVVEAEDGAGRTSQTYDPPALITSVALGNNRHLIALDDDGPDRVLALDRTTVEPSWRFEAPSGAPAGLGIAEDVAYVATTGGAIAALDLDTGDERWRLAVGPVRGPPAVADGALFVVAPDGTLSAFAGEATTAAAGP